MLWPAISLGVTAAAYWGIGPKIYRKERGRLPVSSRLLLAPTLVGQRLSLLYYRRQCDPWNELTPKVWIGARLSSQEAKEAKRLRVTAVLDLTAEFCETRELLRTNYLNLPVLDLTAMGVPQLRTAVDFISRQSEKGLVYVHCKAGYSRTAMAAGAYLLSSGRAGTVQQALGILRKARPTMVFRPEVISALEKFQAATDTMHAVNLRTNLLV